MIDIRITGLPGVAISIVIIVLVVLAACNVGDDSAIEYQNNNDADAGEVDDTDDGDAECLAVTCEDLGVECGTHDDGCDGQLDCGDCGAGECQDDYSCSCVGEPDWYLCEEEAIECGQAEVVDACGEDRIIECAQCSGLETCEDNVCGCTPSSCEALSANCGTHPDGCGGDVSCGDCGDDYYCAEQSDGSHQCEQGVCDPETCESLDIECGLASDECGGALDCGTCSGSQEACDMDNQCVCQPKTLQQACEEMDYECGEHEFDDGCGGTVEGACGTCGGDEFCDATYSCCDDSEGPVIECPI